MDYAPVGAKGNDDDNDDGDDDLTEESLELL